MEPLDHSDSTVNNTTPRRTLTLKRKTDGSSAEDSPTIDKIPGRVLTLKRKSRPPADRPTTLEFVNAVENWSLEFIEKAWKMEPGASIRRELSEDALAVFRREIFTSVGRKLPTWPRLDFALDLLAETERLPRRVNFDPVQQRRLMRLVAE